MATTRQEFAAWRASPSYQELFSDLSAKVQDAVAEIVNRHTASIERDQFLKGFVYALSEVSAYEPTFITDDEENTDEA